MKLRSLAEAIILQSIEDLWDERYRHESIGFLTGNDFSLLAKIVGMSTEDKIKILEIINKSRDYQSPNNWPNKADRAVTSPQALSAPPKKRYELSSLTA